MSPADSSEAPITAAPPEVRYAPDSAQAAPQGWLRRLRWPIMGGAVLLVLIVGFFIYLTGGRYQSTDDAQVQGARVNVSSSISGRVVAILVHEGQFVHAGQVMFQLDGRPYQTASAEAEANLAQAKLQVDALKTAYMQRLADLKAAEDSAAYLSGESARAHALVAAGTGTAAQAAQAANQADQARQQVAAAHDQVASALDALGGDANMPSDEHPTVRVAAARLATAALNQGYINVLASQDGIATKVDQLQVGDYINASQPVFSLVSNRFWLEANFKENQLEHMRVGELGTVKLDAYPSQRFRVRVTAISPGTGSSFSLLPAENATGNWVKVTQRVPVRLDFTEAPNVPLAAGLSASVKVDTQHSRHLFGDPAR
jgi:membrane fusion protein (multidrug efflux system)